MQLNRSNERPAQNTEQIHRFSESSVFETVHTFNIVPSYILETYFARVCNLVQNSIHSIDLYTRSWITKFTLRTVDQRRGATAAYLGGYDIVQPKVIRF